MKEGASSAVDVAEQIKWFDVLDALGNRRGKIDATNELRMVRECRHPDALWLASLLPSDVTLSCERLHEVMVAQGEDPRAVCVSWLIGMLDDRVSLQRAAETGYAPAQAQLSVWNMGCVRV
jgi:hypothetical protein